MVEIEEIEDSINKSFKNNENEELTYKVFIEKGIKLIDKSLIIICQYNTIINNTEFLINKIKNKTKLINIKEMSYKKLEIDLNFDISEIKEIKDKKIIMRKLKNKLYNLDILLNNYIKNLKSHIFYTYSLIKELSYEKNVVNHEIDFNDIENLIIYYEKIETKCLTDDLFEHIINISNIYILNTKIILCINIIIGIGEILKKHNMILKTIYKKMV